MGQLSNIHSCLYLRGKAGVADMGRSDISVKLLSRVKAQLILDHDEDDDLIRDFIRAAAGYAESYQHRPAGWYSRRGNTMPETTRQAIVMLAAHFYESRDGSTAGFFGDNVQASGAVWAAVNRLLQLDRNHQF